MFDYMTSQDLKYRAQVIQTTIICLMYLCWFLFFIFYSLDRIFFTFVFHIRKSWKYIRKSSKTSVFWMEHEGWWQNFLHVFIFGQIILLVFLIISVRQQGLSSLFSLICGFKVWDASVPSALMVFQGFP